MNPALVANWRQRQQAAADLAARAEQMTATAFEAAWRARAGLAQAAQQPDDDPNSPAPAGISILPF